jgi:hypothetical protein
MKIGFINPNPDIWGRKKTSKTNMLLIKVKCS